jgi:peptidoglycan/LPS O-acetylase OafA/YrhL
VAARTAPARGRLPHLPGLDGLRGLAVLGVLAFHGGIDAVGGGFLGVSLFFTLSGFLITLLLLDEHRATGTIGLRAFWGRRFRRLLPAALLAIALATFVLWRVGDPGSLHGFRADGFAALGYVANWRFILAGQSYASVFEAPSPLLHFWSLAIEEQFYLVFPLVALAVLRAARGSRRTFAIVLGGMFVVSAALPSLLHGSDDRVYFGTDTRAAELLAGALLAVALTSLLARHARHHGRAERGLNALHEVFDPKGRRVLGLLGVGALLVMVAMWVTTAQSTRWVYTGGLPVYAALTAFVIFAAVLPGSPVARALAIRPLRWIGLISYGVYLYHWPVLWVLTPERTGLATVPRLALAAIITFGLALASYHLVERPIRTGVPVWRPHLRPAGTGAARFRLPRPGLLLAGPVAVLIVVVLVFSVSVTGQTPTVDLAGAQAGTLVNTTGGFAGDTGDLTPPAPAAAPSTAATSPSTSAAPSTTAPAPRGPLPPKPIVKPNRPLRVLLVGDSTTVFLTPALNTWGGDNGVWGAANYARIGCGLGRGGARMNHDKAEPVPPQCGDWAKDWPPVLAQLKPDLIVISTGFWDATDRQLPGDAEWRHPGDPIYDAYMEHEFAGAADTLLASGAPVAWIDNPPIKLGRHEIGAAADYPVNDPRRMTRTNEIINEVAATRPAMRVIPYTAFMDAWPGGPLDPQLRPDGLHVDGPGGPLVAPWLGPEILAAYWDVKAGRPTPPR